MPDEVVLPLELSKHLNRQTVESVSGNKERGQLIGWDAAAQDFSYGKISFGSESGVRTSLLDWLRTTRFAKERAVVDFHVHPSDTNKYGTFFSMGDLENFFHLKSPAYMLIVGTPQGGYALLSTAEFSKKGIWESHKLATEVRPFNDSPPTPLTEKARKLAEMGLATYSWTRDGERDKDSAISLRKISTTNASPS